MSDHTPGPCGCRAVDVGEFGYEPFGELTILYCPTHAAAPALLAALERIRGEMGPVDYIDAAIAQAKGDADA